MASQVPITLVAGYSFNESGENLTLAKLNKMFTLGYGLLNGPIPVANGGTGSANAAGARTNLGAAAAGSNSDITALSALTTPLSVAQGGTGAATAANARTALGAAAAGSNSDITGLSAVVLLTVSSTITTPTISVSNTLDAGDGGVIDFLRVDSEGHLQLHGGATQWETLRVSGCSTAAGGAHDPGFAKILDNGSGSTGVFAFLFDPTTEEERFFSVQMPRNWKLASDINALVKWSPVANGSAGQKVCWGLEYSLQNAGSVFANTTIIYGDDHDPDQTLVADTHYMTELGTIDMSDIDTLGAILVCRVFRDATGSGGTDDFASDAALLEIGFNYEVDSFGSNEENTKY